MTIAGIGDPGSRVQAEMANKDVEVTAETLTDEFIREHRRRISLESPDDDVTPTWCHWALLGTPHQRSTARRLLAEDINARVRAGVSSILLAAETATVPREVTAETLTDEQIQLILDDGLDPNVSEDRQLGAIIASARNPRCHPQRRREARHLIAVEINARAKAGSRVQTEMENIIEVTAETPTDAEIRDMCRARPELLDMLMVAIHSADVELRKSARDYFSAAISARAKADK